MINSYFSKNNFTIYHGNCLELLESIDSDSIDMIFADPPYNLSTGGVSVHAGKFVSVDKGEWDKSHGVKDDFKFHMDWIKSAKRVLKQNGTIWITGTYHSIYYCGTALLANNYQILNDIIWSKPNPTPNLSCRRFTASHESIIWARKNKNAKYTFNYDLMKNRKWPEDPLKILYKQMKSIWSIPPLKKEEKTFGKHPTQKPLVLLKRIIIASTNINDIILDPFTGSSTTGIMAHMLNRNFIGIDSEKEYLDLSIKRFGDLNV